MTEHAASFPYLSCMLLAPPTGLLILLCLKNEQKFLIRAVSVVASGISLALAIFVFVTYDKALGGLQFVEKYEWVKTFGITYFVGVEGLNAPLLLLTGIVIFTGCLTMWELENRTKEYFIWMMALVTGVFGVFMSYDMFFFFLFYELAVLPMYLLIGIWGTGPKEYSAMKLTLYLLVGSAFMLVGILGMYFAAQLPPEVKGRTFDLVALSHSTYSHNFQVIAFFLLYLGFGVLAGIWPLHTWSPDGHASAPTAVSMLHAGVLMKLGAYGVLRVGIGCLPQGALTWAWLMGGIAVINIVYGAYVAMGQSDLKYVIAYSSVSHMGVVMLGLAAGNEVAMNGAVFQMFSHGIMTGLFFALVGLVYEKSHTREIGEMGGLARRMPGIALAFTIGGLASFGLPGTSGFIAEFLVFMGTIGAHVHQYALPHLFVFYALGAVFAIVITATYVLRLLQRVFHGPLNEEEYGEVPDARTTEWVTLVILSAILILFGVYPSPLTNLIGSSLGPLIPR